METRSSSEALLPNPQVNPGHPPHYEHHIYEDHMAGRHDHYSVFSPYHPNSVWIQARRYVQRFQSSKFGHYSILLLVALDVGSIFTDLFITLYLCDHKDAQGWIDTQEVLGIVGLVFSSLFVLELVLSIWAFGPGYFKSTFRVFDATIIIIGFCIDVFLRGVDEEIASLVVILRLWRFFKIIEEMSAGAQEELDAVETRMVELEIENKVLKTELAKLKGDEHV